MARVLVIDDDVSLLRALRLGLRAGHHDVTTATNGDEGLTLTALHSPDVVVLDIGLPDHDGLDICEQIRQWSDVPVIILSASGTEDLKIEALNRGADDYVTKPFSMGELEARIRAVLRWRPGPVDDALPAQIERGPLRVDFVHHDVHFRGAPVELTSKEFNLLGFLIRHAGRTCTHQMILRAVWGAGYGDEAQYVHAYVHRLRQKLGDDDGTLVRTVPGVGYRLSVEDSSEGPSPD